MLTPYQFASNRPIDGIDLDGLERVHYKYALEKQESGEVVPVFNFLGVQKSREVQVSTVLGIFGWNPTFHFPLEKEVIVHAATENGGDIGYRFPNMKEAFKAAKSGFENIDPFDPNRTTNAEEMRYNDMIGTSQAFGQIGEAAVNFGIQRGLKNLDSSKAGLQLERSAVDAMGKGYSPVSEVVVPIKNTELLKKLNISSKGDWVKVYEAGTQNGNKIETHYFRNNSTQQVFDVKVKYNYWHQKSFKKLE
ncbi:hypothetical protein [uncultured Algoriphagus sp.]|uniref:hypothetical protein n=1 Tax=uncultured Algoriphagus sp. TaxID=417365 RepID=UPI0030EC3D06|tara:strand:+ start:22739 stop:23485 length:747 start_codon:yes stop_codon:yes gene_type:complete